MKYLIYPKYLNMLLNAVFDLALEHKNPGTNLIKTEYEIGKVF